MRKTGKCETIIFDLEYYVPPSSRKEIGLNYNPWDKKCRLLGGSFLTISPFNIGNSSPHQLKKRVKSLWLWNHESEKELLTKIYELMKKTSDKTRNGHDGRMSAVMCGIGITNSDIPVLFELFKRYHILTNAEAFDFQNSFRFVDASQIAIGLFGHGNYLYPIPKGALTSKYTPGIKFDSGESVWGMYESKSYSTIQSRVNDEVIMTYQVYEGFIDEIDKHKSLVKSHKNAVKKAKKEQETA